MNRRLLVAVVALTLLTLPFTIAQAAELPTTPDPADCTVAPVTIARLEEMAATEPEETAPDDFDAVEPVSPEIGAEIERTLIEAVACTNANQPLRALALFTDRYLAERFGGEDNPLLGHLEAVTTRSPDVAPPEERLTLVSIDNVRGGGSVVHATVVTQNRVTTFTDEITFRLVDDRWLIDEVALGESKPA
jgi:hypothetical protein